MAFKSALSVAFSLFLVFILLNFNYPAAKCETNLMSLVKWKFHSYHSLSSLFSGNYNTKVLLVSLADGTITAIDIDNGSVLWSINEDDSRFMDLSFFSKKMNGKDYVYIPSSTGDLYKLKDDIAERIDYDSLGRTNMNKNLYMTSSRQDTITIGVDLISGKLYYYCSSISCFKNNSIILSSSDCDHMVIIKRIVTVHQLIDITTGDELVKYMYGRHEIFMFSNPTNKGGYSGESKEILSEMNDVHYDINLHRIYGFGRISSFSKIRMKCWKIDLSSPIMSSYMLKQKNGLYVTCPIKLNDFMSIDVDGNYILSDLSTNLMLDKMGEKHSTKSDICYDIMFLNVYNNMPFLQRIDDVSSSKECPRAKIYSFSKIKKNDATGHLIPGTLSFNQLNDAIHKITTTRHKVYQYKLPTLDITSLRVKVTWRAMSLKAVNALAESQENDINIVNPNQEIILVVSIFSLWKEIIIVSASFTIILFTSVKYYRRYRPKVEEKKMPTTIVVTTTIVNINLMPILKICQRPMLLTSTSTIKDEKNESFKALLPSRFESDFADVETIGSGGFGHVFKAKNIVDDCVYAIKRITLPNCGSAKERVMREVKALAKLNHPGIIRFYNAWFEDAQPKDIKEKKDILGSVDVSGSDGTITNLNTRSLHLTKTIQSSSHLTDILSLFPTSNNQNKTNFKMISTHKNDDVSIVFEESDGKKNTTVISTTTSHTLEDVGEGSMSSDPECSSKSSGDISCAANSTGFSFIESCDNRDECLHSKKIYLYIQMELCHKNTLRSWLLTNTSRPIRESLYIFSQILTAIQFIHSQGLIHRDLKPSNIFFAYDNTIKIGDFGLVARINSPNPSSSSNQNDENTECIIEISGTTGTSATHIHPKLMTKNVGTELYMSPEQLASKPYCFKVDIYSLGLILFELLVPYKTQFERILLLKAIKKYQFPSDFEIDDVFKNIIHWMLIEDPKHRPTAIELINSELVKDAMNKYNITMDNNPYSRLQTNTNPSPSSFLPLDYP